MGMGREIKSRDHHMGPYRTYTVVVQLHAVATDQDDGIIDIHVHVQQSRLQQVNHVISRPSLLDRLCSPALSDLCRLCRIHKVDVNRVSPSGKKQASTQVLNAVYAPRSMRIMVKGNF